MQSQIFFKGSAVFLSLTDGTGESRQRLLGRIENRVFICRRSDNSVMRINDSLGFNAELMRSADFDSIIIFMSPSGRMLTTRRETVLQYGKFLQFKKMGFEKQLFLPIADFGKTVMPANAKPVIKQTELFR